VALGRQALVLLREDSEKTPQAQFRLFCGLMQFGEELLGIEPASEQYPTAQTEAVACVAEALFLRNSAGDVAKDWRATWKAFATTGHWN